MGEAKAKATGEREAREVPRDRDRTDDGQVLQARRQGGDGGGQARAEEEVGGTPARFALSLSLDLDARNSISSLPSPLRPRGHNADAPSTADFTRGLVAGLLLQAGVVIAQRFQEMVR